MSIPVNLQEKKPVESLAEAQKDEKRVKSGGSRKRKACPMEGCDRYLSVVNLAISCRCEKNFCDLHRDVIAHGCKAVDEKVQAAAKPIYQSAHARDGFSGSEAF